MTGILFTLTVIVFGLIYKGLRQPAILTSFVTLALGIMWLVHHMSDSININL
ncbi:DUF5993 family protein [Desulfotalea psychrophila]|uniref:DUF5993 family protein n=1 Tax=Desulfotalea psychrophila TaxID=84980 RepID=UPI002692C3BA